MTLIPAFSEVIGSNDRVRVVNELPADEVELLLRRLLERGRALEYIDQRELLLLLVQRFDFAMLDLELADQYRRTPNLVEPVLEDRILARTETILGEKPSEEIVALMVRRTKAAARRLDNVGTPQDDVLVLENAVGKNGQLRCTSCGYHFRETDVRSSLRDAARLDDMEFAEALHPSRANDDLKPVRSKTKKGEMQSWTALEIEHRVPRAALGENTRENLTVACRWCNRGKLAYQSYAEALPSLLAVSLGALHQPWAIRHVARAFYVAVNREGSCATCQAEATEKELTITKYGRQIGARRAFEVRPACYECRDLI